MAFDPTEDAETLGQKSTYVHTNLVELLRDSSTSIQGYLHQHRAEFDAYNSIATSSDSETTSGENASFFDGKKLLPFSVPLPDSFSDLECLYRSICKIQAPMVRCSRPAFRKVCRLWGTDISYTHMILADSFVRSEHARRADFSIYEGETRLVTQLAANEGPLAASAALFVAPFSDAIDLNCGCPQSWVVRDGLGAALLEKPEVVSDLIHCINNALAGSSHSVPCVVKMRIARDLRRSVDFARQIQAAGAGWITVHARTPSCNPSSPALFSAVRIIQENLSIPVVVNGGFHDPSSALGAALTAGVGGVMMANGLLDNPTAFCCFQTEGENSRDKLIPLLDASRTHMRWYRAGEKNHQAKEPSKLEGFTHCPLEALSDFLRLSLETNLSSATVIQHAVRMARPYLSPLERVYISQLKSTEDVCKRFTELGLFVKGGRVPSVESHSLDTN